MTTKEAPAFGELLSHYRVAAGLTQEELAERASLSVRGISDLERSVRTRPQPMTVRQLAEALQLSPPDRAIFEEAAHASGVARHRDETLPEGSFLGALPSASLVGREDDVERFESTLDAVAEGLGRVLLLSGEPGVGKTRLLQELMVAARSRGFLVLTGRCDAAVQQTAYAPFLDGLGGLTASLPSGARSEGQRLWKRVQQMVRAASDRADMVEQQQLYGAVADLLVLVAQSVPLALLLDDLQWADSGSLKLLPHLARATRSSSVLLAGAFRDAWVTAEHPDLVHTLQLLSRERLAERITARRLSLEETMALVAATMGQKEVSEEFASFVYRRTKGISRLIDQLVRSLGGRLELQGEIGAGAMGRVFRAFDRKRGQTVAAKLVLARQEIGLDTLLRFQQEGAVLAQLEHPHIVAIYDTFVEEHASCIIMELLDGQSLGQLLQDGPLPLPRAKNLGQQVAEALSYAHSQGIIHRDIKPDNVMVLDGDQVKVTDFGIARILQPDTSLQTIATTGMRMGTPLYMAPEQIEGKKIDARTDIYALGAMLYHMVTGRPPFEGSDALAVAVKHLQDEPVPPSQIDPAIPADWDALILKAMAKDPKDRFQSAPEMQHALEALPVEPASHETARWRACYVAPAIVAGAMAAVAAAVVALAVVIPRFAAGQGHSRLQRKLDGYLTSLVAQHQLSGTVLVAQNGKILLAKGYGLANREPKIPNDRATVYPVGRPGSSMTIVAALKLEEQGKLHDQDRVCSYLSSCPRSWESMTIRMVLDGKSGLPVYDWSTAGNTAGALATCQATRLTATPGRGPVNYQTCTQLVLGTIIEKVTGKPFATVIHQLVLGPAGMRHSGLLVDQHLPSRLAQEYSGGGPGQQGGYNGAFAMYATAPDIYRFDKTLFGGGILSQSSLRRLFALRDPVTPSDPNIVGASWGYYWKIGTAFGHQIDYLTGVTYSFSNEEMRFPGDGVSIIVISNDDQDDVLSVATHVAASMFGASIASPSQALAPAISPSEAIVAAINAPHTLGAMVPSNNGALWVGTDNGTVMRLDPATNKVAATIKINDSLTPSGVADPGIVQVVSGSGQLWALDRVHKAVVRIDPATNRVTARVPTGIEPFSSAIANDTLWVGTSYEDDPGVNTIVRIDLRTEKVAGTITNATSDLGEPFLSLAASPHGLWFVDWAGNTLKRLDPATNKVIAAIKVHNDPQPSFQVVDGPSIWVTSHYSNVVTRIDAQTNAVIASIPLSGYPSNANIGSDCCGQTLAVGAGAVWSIAGSDQRTLVRIDPRTNLVTASLTFSQPIGPVAFANGSVWIHSDYTLYRIDPAAMKGT